MNSGNQISRRRKLNDNKKKHDIHAIPSWVISKTVCTDKYNSNNNQQVYGKWNKETNDEKD